MHRGSIIGRVKRAVARATQLLCASRNAENMKHLLQLTIFVVVVAASASVARACFCIIDDVPESFERANAVFLGEVTDVTDPQTTDVDAPLPGRLYTITFAVEKSWKGVSPVTTTVKVLSAQGHYGCFAYPEVHKGERYLVYADAPYENGAENRAWNMIWSCNRTAKIEFTVGQRDIDPVEDMKVLDSITAPPSFKLDFNPTWHLSLWN